MAGTRLGAGAASVLARALAPVAVLALGAAVTPAAAVPVVSPALSEALKGAAPEQPLRVRVQLEERFPAHRLEQDLRRRRVAAPARHRILMEALQAHAHASQTALLRFLAAQGTESGVNGFTGHWITNAVLVDATPRGVERLRTAPISGTLIVEPTLPVGIQPAPSPLTPLAVGGRPWNLEQIAVPRLWALGVTGRGRLVANIDSGVDAAHPALAESWRGHLPGVEPDAAWLSSDGSREPSDSGSHGTHTMGIMVGAAVGDTVGVAPGAAWIAAQLRFSGPPGVSTLEALEWCADPDGDPATYDDVPDAVNNSWSYDIVDCGNWDAPAIDNLELLGPVAVFASGNNGPDPSSVVAPANRAVSAVSNFAVGASGENGALWAGSARGPSLCAGSDSLAIKPELVAPGLAVRSTIPGGGYAHFTGTSMAAPHVAGAVALLRQIQPELTADEIKRLLIAHARHPDGVGRDDNDFGHGILDVAAAAQELFAREPVLGVLAVTVRAAEGGTPLAGVQVRLAEATARVATDSLGVACFQLLRGEYTAEVAPAVGYAGAIGRATVIGGDTTWLSLQPMESPQGWIQGALSDSTGAPVSALISVYEERSGALCGQAQSDADGRFGLPVAVGVYRLEGRATAPWANFQEAPVVVDSASIVDISRTLQPADVLILDAAPDSSDHDSLVIAAVVASGRSFSYLERSGGDAVAGVLRALPPSSAVVCFSGEAGEQILDPGEEDALGELLDRGGRLFLTGRDLVASLDGGPLLDARLGLRLGAETDVHDLPAHPASGPGLILDRPVFTAGFEPPTAQHDQDVIVGGMVALDYRGVESGAALVSVLRVPGAGRAVVAGFGIEGVHGEFSGSLSRAELMGAVLDWLGASVEIAEPPESPPAGAVAQRPQLLQNRPNPFNPRTRIPLLLPVPGLVRIGIFDLRGRQLAELHNGYLDAGSHTFLWEGADAGGAALPSGVYFCRVQASGRVLVRKMLLLK